MSTRGVCACSCGDLRRYAATKDKTREARFANVQRHDADAEECSIVGDVKLVDEVIDYIAALIRGTRDVADLETGASPRAGAMLAGAARARAAPASIAPARGEAPDWRSAASRVARISATM